MFWVQFNPQVSPQLKFSFCADGEVRFCLFLNRQKRESLTACGGQFSMILSDFGLPVRRFLVEFPFTAELEYKTVSESD